MFYFQGLDLKNLGSLASSKLQLMRAKENIDKPVMKTKVFKSQWGP